MNLVCCPELKFECDFCTFYHFTNSGRKDPKHPNLLFLEPIVKTKATIFIISTHPPKKKTKKKRKKIMLHQAQHGSSLLISTKILLATAVRYTSTAMGTHFQISRRFLKS